MRFACCNTLPSSDWPTPTILTVDSAMGSVGPSPHLGSSIDLNGFDDQVVSVQALSTTTSKMRTDLNFVYQFVVILIKTYC